MKRRKIKTKLCTILIVFSSMHVLNAQSFNPPNSLRLSEWCYNYNFLWSPPDSSSSEFLHYNLYKDSTLFDTTSLRYCTMAFDSGYHDFGVSAVYDGGESDIIFRNIMAPLGKTPNLLAILSNMDEMYLSWWGVCYYFWASYMNNLAGGYSPAGITGIDSATYAIKWTWYNVEDSFVAEFTELHFMPSIFSGTGATDFHFKIIQADSAQSLIYFQDLEGVQYNEWNSVVIDPPLPINTSESIYLGITVINDVENGNAACLMVDDFIPEPGYGDLISFDDSTWMQAGEGDWVISGYYTNALWYGTRQTGISDERSGIVSQYDIYRNGEYIGSTDETKYVDSNFTLSDCGNYFEYYVIAQYNTCTSAPSDTVGSILDCTSYFNEPDKSNLLAIFPNPANEKLNIKVDQPIEQLIINDTFGREVLKITHIFDDIQLDCSSFKSGIYFIRGTISNLWFSEKFVVIHK